MSRDPEGIIGTRRAETDIEGGLWAQREASPEADHGERPRGRVTVNGGRALARERNAPRAGSQRATLLAIYTAHGPCTRNAAAAVLCGQDPPTPEAMNTTQGRTHEMLAAGALRIIGHDPDTGRGLVAVRPPTPERI